MADRFRDTEVGSSELIAEIVKNATGFDEYAITVDKKYSSSYGATVSEAGDENDSGVIRPLTEPLPDVSGYDDIILIYPLWWWTLPQPVKTWLEKTNLSGKTLHVIVTHQKASESTAGAFFCPMGEKRLHSW